MPIHPRLQPRKSIVLAASALAPVLWLSVMPASAGFFDFLAPPPPPPPAPVVQAPATPTPSQAPSSPRASASLSPSIAPNSSQGAGHAVAFCVRLCDGRFFPVAPRTGATPVQICSALCPAARIKIFQGAEISHARAADGTRYADLDNAFLYRKTLVASCTCNGKDAFGTAPVDIGGDPTLRAGDLVATSTGLVPSSGARPKTSPAATPVDPAQVQSAHRKLVTASAMPVR